MEQADVTCTGLIQPVFQRNIIDKRFYVISSIGTGRNFTSQHYLKTIVKETLGIAETVVRPLTTGIRIIMIFYSERKAGILHVSCQSINLAGKHGVKRRSHIQIHTASPSRIGKIYTGSQHSHSLFATLVRPHTR